MSGEFQFFDIIILAMIAGFLILRLRKVLGRRDGHEGSYPDIFRKEDQPETESDSQDNVVQLPDRSGQPLDQPAEDFDLSDPVGAGLTQIRVANPKFNAEEFLAGSKMAFEMILNGFSSNDRKTLKSLLSPEVYKTFEDAIAERERSGEVLEDTLVGIRSAKIIEAQMDGHHSVITVKFVSEQISALRDADGNIIDGNPNEVIDVTDFWTFSRDTRSSDPNWTLIGTESNN